MFSLLQDGCTSVLDSAIADARLAYASERDDFHTYFRYETVAQIQRLTRGRVRTHRSAIFTGLLLRAQKESPHDLWTLLLAQALESHLVDRRRALGLHDDATLDAQVFEDFLAAVEDIPVHINAEDLKKYVLLAAHCAPARASRPKLAA
jgi:hypothetical protein